MQDYIRPSSIAEVVENLKTPGAMIICGGTDLLIKRRMGIVDPNLIIDISDLPPLQKIEENAGSIEIGAAVPVSNIIRSALINDKLPLLAQVLKKLGSVQIRSRASLGGNLVNASPAADSAIPLLLHEAKLALVSTAGERELLVEGFVRGPGRTALEEGEFIRAVSIPIPAPGFVPFFHKVGRRKALTIAIASLGGLARVRDGTIEEMRLAAGSVAPTPLRLREVEEFLSGETITEELIKQARELAYQAASPIDDIRGSGAYRRTVIADLLARFLKELRDA